MEHINQNCMGYIGAAYQELTLLNGNETYKTALVRRNNDGRIFVKKEISPAQGGIYQQLSSIQHPNLVGIHKVCFGQKSCIVLEDYIGGRTLQELMEDRKSLSREEVRNYFGQILNGLELIHSYHIIHRDIKPENILISADGVVKLLDFGIARFQKEHQSRDTTVLGTAGYASPEQFGFQQTDVRTDIYAAGILLNNLLTGKMPDEAQVEDVQLRKVIGKCMEIDPRNRYASVKELRTALAKAGLGKRKGRQAGKAPMMESRSGIDGSERSADSADSRQDITWIPGFRTGVLWKKILACLGYTIILMCHVIFPSQVFPGGGMAVLLELLAMFLYIWLPVAIGGNLFRWDRKIPGIRRLPGELRGVLRFVLCFVTIYFGFFLDNYVQYDMMGLPGSK